MRSKCLRDSTSKHPVLLDVYLRLLFILSLSQNFPDFLGLISPVAPQSTSASARKLPRCFFRGSQQNPEDFLVFCGGSQPLGCRKQGLSAVSSPTGISPEASGLQHFRVPTAFRHGAFFQQPWSCLGLAWIDLGVIPIELLSDRSIISYYLN